MGSATRRAGILLPLTALPAARPPFRCAYSFIDFLAAAGQSIWQILPIGPVGEALSPYQSASAFAGNPAFIDKAAVAQEPERYDPAGAAYAQFLEENKVWLDDYALFVAVQTLQQGRPLSEWPRALRNPSEETLRELAASCAPEMDRIRYEQFCFFQQWREIKRYAYVKGVSIIGDLPMYVCEDSADFWLRRDAFDVTKGGRPAALAGVPADEFSKNGQTWNTPVYAWHHNREAVLAFWRARLTQAARLYDGIRLDHFRGFADFYAILPSGKGVWRLGPGSLFVDMLKEEFPGLFVVAEDLGALSETASRLVADSGFPGTKVLQFAFSGGAENPYLPHNIQKNAVVYTGTHDNNTLLGWVRTAPREEIARAAAYLGLSADENLRILTNALLAASLASHADTVIVPMQDWLCLDASARMNTPGTVGGQNWKWRTQRGTFTKRLASRICHMSKELYGR